MWEYGGYRGTGNVEALINSMQGKGVAAICGNARPVFDELREILEVMGEGVTIFAVNDVGMYLARIDHWVTLHYEKLQAWRSVRLVNKNSPAPMGPGDLETYKTHTVPNPTNPAWGNADYRWENLEPYFWLSGYFAMQVAYLMGFGQIILCGCPGDDTPRFFDSSEGRADSFVYQTEGGIKQLETQTRINPKLKQRVASMSGYSREFFGGIEKWQLSLT